MGARKNEKYFALTKVQATITFMSYMLFQF